MAFSISPNGVSFLRDSLQRDYLVISDDLASATMIERYGLRAIMTGAVKAGVDVLLVCHSPYPLEACACVLEAAQSGAVPTRNMEQSAAKIIERKRHYFYGR